MGTSTDPHDPKQQARRLRTALAESGTPVSHGQALDLVARLHGHRDWNTLSAADPAAAPAPARGAIPLLRIFDTRKAMEFYVGFLGFEVAWEHRYDDHAPLYAEVVRDGVRLHLTEHHGDASPGPRSTSRSTTPSGSSRSCWPRSTTTRVPAWSARGGAGSSPSPTRSSTG